MEHKQNTSATIDHQCAMRNKFHDHSRLVYQSLKKLAVVERMRTAMAEKTSLKK